MAKKKIVRENLIDEQEKPTITPTRTKPDTKPKEPTPIRRQRPSVIPKPKATEEDVAKKFLALMTK